MSIDMNNLKNPIPVNADVRVLRSMILDALKVARELATRAEEATSGTEAAPVFSAVRQEIKAFTSDANSMQSMTIAAIRETGKKILTISSTMQ